ncbi:MAG TPA: hypothetical protein VIK40_09865 [Geomonas sp.]
MDPLKHRAFICAVAALILAAVAQAAFARELYILGGAVQASDPSERTYSWQLEYRRDLLKHLAAGVCYLNEGHITGHHRDGYTVQLWTRTELLDRRLALAAAAGPYFFLDTASRPDPQGFSNDHGWKAMLSAAATWHTESDLLFELRSNWVKGPSGFDSVSVLAGLGYQFEPALESLAPKAATPEQEIRNEVTLFLGQTIVNSLDSQKSVAAGLEYRRHLSRHLDWTLAGLYEGDNRLIRRDGVITQLWATEQLLDGALSVGAGGGAYFNVGHYRHPEGSRPLSGIISLTGSYRFTPHWAVRACWNRIVTSYERDADIFLGGVGYRF